MPRLRVGVDTQTYQDAGTLDLEGRHFLRLDPETHQKHFLP